MKDYANNIETSEVLNFKNKIIKFQNTNGVGVCFYFIFKYQKWEWIGYLSIMFLSVGLLYGISWIISLINTPKLRQHIKRKDILKNSVYFASIFLFYYLLFDLFRWI